MRLPLAALLALALVAPAGAATGPDYVTSDNVEYLGFLKADIGQTTGARIVGKKLYVTSAKNIAIYDISDPAKPNPIGSYAINLGWENEEVPTDGKILGVSSDFFNVMPSCNVPSPQLTNCQQLFDVRDPANIKELPAIPASGDHTADCVLACTYLFGNTGTITDLRGVLDGAQPKVLGSWQTPVLAQLGLTKFSNGCHHIREIKPGYLFAACEPFVYFRVVGPGASITHPVVIADGKNQDNRFVHSVRWPNEATDKLALIGGETNFSVKRRADLGCDGKTDAAFMTVDASHVDETGKFSKPLDEYRPQTGSYTDGNTPAEIAGCSVHWYQEHESFHDGGLVALAAYDNGIRFLQVASDGKITEQGYFQPLGFETSSPKWVPGTDIVYSIDYARGIDILRWNGKHYVPGKPERRRLKGTNGKQPVLPALTSEQKAFAVREASLLQKSGWFQGYCQLAANRA
jgi:hypothetical protein